MSRQGSRRFNLLIALALPLLVAAIYWPVLKHGFVAYDDPDYVSANPHVLAGWSWAGIHWSLTTTFAANYLPLTWITLMAQAAVFGTWAGGYHAVDAAVHALNALLLWHVLSRMTGKPGRAAVVAMLFAVHPMHVESVAWAAEWKDVLSTCLALLCLGCYGHSVQSPRRGLWYAGVLVAFTLSLAAKPMYVTLPGVMLLLDAWPLRRLVSVSQRRLAVLEKIPLLILAVADAGAALIAQSRGGAVASVGRLPFPTRLGNAAVASVVYLQKLLLPTRLAVFYPYPPLSTLTVAGSTLLLILISVMAIRFARQRPALIVGWSWFLLTLLPVIGLVQVGAQSMADRYSYFPSVGIFLAATWLLADAAEGSRFARRAAMALAVVIIAGDTVLAARQVGYWQDTRALFEHAAAVTDDNWVADLQLGDLAFTGNDLATAAAYYTQVIQLQPNDGRGYDGLANCLVDRNTAKAVTQYEQALRRNPRSPAFHLNLAKALAREGNRPAALKQCQIAQQLDPTAEEAAELSHRLRP